MEFMVMVSSNKQFKGWYTKTTEHTLLFFAGIPLKKVVGLRPKMYSLTYDIMRKDAV
jgi:hypothetical protein